MTEDTMDQDPDLDAFEDDAPRHSVPVYAGDNFRVAAGANLGDALMEMEELVLDDTYQLGASAKSTPLSFTINTRDESFRIAPGSACGCPGNTVHLDSVATFMLADGDTIEALILVEVAADDGGIEQIFLLPLTGLGGKTDYRLIGVRREGAKALFGEVACTSFTRGTKITMADGRQVPVEDLKVGDRVLTRDCGAQVLRWIGTRTTRAAGDFAPVLIQKGALNNSDDLLVSPNHRLFVYQRKDALGIGRAEVMVRAEHLVNGTSVTRAMGGFVDYFRLLFDEQQIIYAEGIATESMLLSSRTHAVLPADVAVELGNARINIGESPHDDLEVPRSFVGDDTARQLKDASRR